MVKARDTVTLVRVDDGAKGNPTGITVSASEPTNKYTGMLWKCTGNVSGKIQNATYRWNGSSWELYIFIADNIDVDSLFAKSITAKKMTIEGDSVFKGKIDGATGTFAGNVAAKSVTIESTDTTDAGKNADMSVSSNGFNLITNSVTDSGAGHTYFTQNIVSANQNGVNVEVADKAIVDGRTVTNAKSAIDITPQEANVSSNSINLNASSKANVTAPEGFYVNGVKQYLYDWTNADTYDTSSPKVPVINGNTIHYRDIPTDEFTLQNKNGWYKYGKRTHAKFNGDYVGNVKNCPYPPKGNPVYQYVMFLNTSNGGWWPGFMQINTDGTIACRTITALGAASLFECTGTGFKVYGTIDFFNF